MKLYAIRVFVRSWEESCAFYRDSLELTERFRSDKFGWAEYDIGGPCFGLQYVGPDDKEGASLVGRFVGVSLQVESIDATYDELRKRNVRFTSPPTKQEWGGALAHFLDPDDNELTLLG